MSKLLAGFLSSGDNQAKENVNNRIKLKKKTKSRLTVDFSINGNSKGGSNAISIVLSVAGQWTLDHRFDYSLFA